MEIFENGQWLPLAFAALMALAAFVYAILDGYDIGIGILMNNVGEKDRDIMISSIGPFWDANETWLVLTIGIMLIAFPQANGIFLTNLYLPTVLMLAGLILRGVSFDFRAKAKVKYKTSWDKAFTGGSFLMAISQGYMIGSYVLGFEKGFMPLAFSLVVGLSTAAAYALIGSSWLIIKTEGELQKKAVGWARKSLLGMVVAIVLVAIASPLASQHVAMRWMSYPDAVLILPVPLIIIGLVAGLERKLRQLPMKNDAQCWVPFAMTAGIFFMCLFALGYSFYPYIIPGQLKIVDAASSYESLMFILVGALGVLPFLIGYTIYAYKVFAGKTRELTYN